MYNIMRQHSLKHITNIESTQYKIYEHSGTITNYITALRSNESVIR